MADLFSTDDARNLLKNKFVFLIGDSNMRATYKDLVLLISRNEILSMHDLRKRGEESFERDRRIAFGGQVTRGRQYVEGREYLHNECHIEYHFITRCHTPEIVDFMTRIKSKLMRAPDVIVMNSCVWDISRWGPNGVEAYKANMQKLMNLLNTCLPKSTLFIWTTALPVSTEIGGGLIIKQIDFMQNLLRFEVMEANLFCRHLIVAHGYDVLDTHYHLRMQIHRRLKDGIHYGPLPVRYITNLILTHISLSWNVPLPGRTNGIALQRVIKKGVLQVCKDEKVVLPTVPGVLVDQKNKEQHNNKNNNQTQVKRPVGQNPNKPKRNGHFKKNNYPHQNAINHRQAPQWQNDGWQNEVGPPAWQNDCPRNWPKANNVQQQHHHHQQGRYGVGPQHNEYWNNNNNMHNYPDPRPSFNEDFTRSKYENFDQAAGPIRANPRYPQNRNRPY